MAWGLLGVSPGDGNVLGWSLGVKEGAAWAGLEDGNRSWAPRAEDGAVWGVAVSPARPAVDSIGLPRRTVLYLRRVLLGCKLTIEKDAKK